MRHSIVDILKPDRRQSETETERCHVTLKDGGSSMTSFDHHRLKFYLSCIVASGRLSLSQFRYATGSRFPLPVVVTSPVGTIAPAVETTSGRPPRSPTPAAVPWRPFTPDMISNTSGLLETLCADDSGVILNGGHLDFKPGSTILNPAYDFTQTQDGY